ncbi:DUF1638 domain-containing protein [candidate division KSB1 bacterium]|nr:DUF1638 domain-containing protein [candidate division KSB1 bacterium]
MQKFHIISCHVLWRELCYFAALSKNVFTFHFLKQGLHDKPDNLRRELQQAIDAVQDDSAAILIGYGLCSNGVVGITAHDKKLVLMRGHDCITFLLGSKERYQAYFERYPGTYWYSPGWIDSTEMPGPKRYQQNLNYYIEKYGQENAAYLMEMEQAWVKNYSRATFIDMDFYDAAALQQFTRECANYLGWEFDMQKGDDRLLTAFLEGDWDDENFLIAEPGQTIIAAYDDRILAVEDKNET